jgi:hypothetical protein
MFPLIRYLLPTPLCSARITRLHRSYRRLRLPSHHRFLPRCLGLSGSARVLRANARISLVTTHSSYKARYGLRSRGSSAHLPFRDASFLPAGMSKPSAYTFESDFGTRFLQGQHDLLPLHLASFRTYASSTPLPRCLQGSIPSPWLAATGAGITPA